MSRDKRLLTIFNSMHCMHRRAKYLSITYRITYRITVPKSLPSLPPFQTGNSQSQASNPHYPQTPSIQSITSHNSSLNSVAHRTESRAELTFSTPYITGLPNVPLPKIWRSTCRVPKHKFGITGGEKINYAE